MPSPGKSWTVVLFTEDQTVEAVPSRWINGDTCLWPTVPRDRLNTLLKNCEYNSCWPSLPVRIFRNATYDDFCTARTKARKAEETSELNTDDDVQEEWGNSKRIPKKRIFSSSESSGDEQISLKKTMPTKKKKLPPAPTWIEDLSFNIEDVTDNAENNAPSQEASQASQSSQCDNDVLSPNNKCRCNPHLIHNIHCMLLDLNKKVEKLLTREPASVTATKVNILEKSKINYPMTKEEELNKFEEFIASPEHFSAMVIYFASQGGGNTYEFIRRCIAPVVGDELCQRFSFTGKKGKKEFGKLKIARAIIESAQKIGLSSNKKDIELKIGDWLRRAPSRKMRSEAKAGSQTKAISPFGLLL